MSSLCLADWAGVAIVKDLWHERGDSFGHIRLPGHDLSTFVVGEQRDMKRLRDQLPEAARPFVHLPTECCKAECREASHKACVWSALRWRFASSSTDPAVKAARAGCIELFDYVQQNRFGRFFGCISVAAFCGNGALVRHILTLGWRIPLTSHDCSDALTELAERGDLETVHSMLQYGFRMTPSLMKSAAKSGSIPLLRYLCNRGCPANEGATAEAASTGNMAALAFLVERGCPVTALAAARAASNGHLAVVQYLLEHGHPVSSKAIATAADSGHLAVVQYLHEVGAPIDDCVLDWAYAAGHTDVIKYGLAHKFPGHDEPVFTAYLGRAADA